MNLRDLANVVARDDVGKQDIEVRSNEIKVSEDGVLIVDGQKLWPSDWAWYLMINRASQGKVTKRYVMNGRPVEDWSKMINHDLARSDQEWILRTRGNQLLGIVSTKYRAYNNRDAVKGLIENLGGETPVHRYFLSDRMFFVRSLYPDGGFKIGQGDAYRVGFTTTNSEVGFRSLANAAFLFRLACTNDAQMMTHTSMKFRHVGHSFWEMTGELGRSIDRGRGLKEYYADLVRRAAEDRIPDAETEAVLERVRELLQASKKRTAEIAALYAAEGQGSRMGLVNAITHYAQRFAGERRFDLEAGAGALLEGSLAAA